MSMSFRRYLRLLLVLMLFWSVGRASNTQTNTPEEPRRKFSQEEMKDLSEDPDFYYVEMQENEEDVYDVWSRYFGRIMRKIFGSEVSYRIIDNFEYIIIAIVLLIIYLNRKRIKFDKIFIPKDQKATKIILDFDEENIEEADFEELTRQALEAGNYKVAVRYQFLDVLKRLDAARMIRWEPYKTNFEYLLEIKNPEVKKHFRNAALVFDYIWYGNLNLTKQQYLDSLDELKLIKQKLPKE